MKPAVARQDKIAEMAREQRAAKRGDVDAVLAVMAEEHGKGSPEYQELEAIAEGGMSFRSLMVLRRGAMIRIRCYEDSGEWTAAQAESALHAQMTELRHLIAADEPERRGPGVVVITIRDETRTPEQRAANRGPGLVVE